MKRWIGAFIGAVVGCLLILAQRSSDPSLLRDTDTKVLLEAIRARHAPLSWFGGDWPLQNHFYRPVPTLAFELDHRLYGNEAWGYGLTNAILCVLCTLLLFWFLRELTDNRALTSASTLLFALWQTAQASWLIPPIQLLIAATVIGGILRHRQKIRYWLPPALVGFELILQIGSAAPIGERTISWLPGRTATVMTVFALAAMAAYARYERLGALRVPQAPTPLDPPSTKGSLPGAGGHGRDAHAPWIWAVVAVVGSLLAMASYEQGVMVPAALLGVAITMYWRGYRVRWGWQAPFWGCLVAYAVFRHAVVPSSASSYQLQQFRSGPGVWMSLIAYTIPSIYEVVHVNVWLPDLPLVLFTSGPWLSLLGVAADAATLIKVRLHWIFAAAGAGLAFVAYLPMAWLKQFDHYHYWPLALKSLLVTTIGWIAWDLAVSAWSPQTRRAPPRLDPAPGSLPRP